MSPPVTPEGAPSESAEDAASAQPDAPLVSLRQGLPVWLAVAAQSFGGPAGQIAVMHRILVEERRWVSEARFLHALNYCMLLPGPEAQQLATYIGWLLHRTPGALLAGGLFVLPGFVAILALSFVYVLHGDAPLVAGLFMGIKPAVLAIVMAAVVRIGRRALKHRALKGVAATAFAAIFFAEVPFPWIVAGGSAAGLMLKRWAPQALAGTGGGHAGSGDAVPLDPHSVAARLDAHPPAHTRPSWARAVCVALTCGLLWGLPLLALALLMGGESVFTRLGTFFSQAAVVTFGGAYAVLAYVAQQAVEVHGWLQPGEMLDGLGMAETTPGPLIMVVQFVGFMGAYRFPGGIDPLLAGVFGALITTWVTFVPCFLWILLGAPWIEALRNQKSLSAALTGITAAVVGVILNLAAWFGLHTLFGQVDTVPLAGLRLLVPDPASLHLPSLVIAVFALVASFRFRAGLTVVLGGSAAAGAVWTLLGG